MIEFRPFLNTDPPFLAEVWRSQPPLHGMVQTVSSSALEKHVLSKPYFDRHGLIVAEEGGRVAGFVHAGFGPRDDLQSLSHDEGVISRLMVVPHENRDPIASELLSRGEAYLRAGGARRFHGGGYFPFNPYYLGLYGGARLPGVLEEDHPFGRLLEEHGYRQVGRQLIFRCRLPGFRAPINRQQMTVRRQYQIVAVIDPIPDTWWDACTLGMTDRTRFVLKHRQSGEIHGSVTFWDMEPLASGWGVHAMGLYDLYVVPDRRRQGLATFLIGEAMRQLQSQGITLSEVQMPELDHPTIELFHGLGFEQAAAGRLLVKS